MYHMDHLLTMLTSEKAKELRFRAGTPPVFVTDEEKHPLQGPPISSEEVMQLLRSMATSRHLRDLRENGEVRFIFTPRGRAPFLIRARMCDDCVEFQVS